MIGSMVGRCYNVLYNVFFLLYITSYVPTGMYTLQEAKDAFSNMTLIALFFGIGCTIPASMLTDKIQPKYMMLPGFIFRGIFLVLFVNIPNPTSW